MYFLAVSLLNLTLIVLLQDQGSGLGLFATAAIKQHMKHRWAGMHSMQQHMTVPIGTALQTTFHFAATLHHHMQVLCSSSLLTCTRTPVMPPTPLQQLPPPYLAFLNP
jgi:hypothetical protein